MLTHCPFVSLTGAREKREPGGQDLSRDQLCQEPVLRSAAHAAAR